MGTSYQDIEMRLRFVEDFIKFLGEVVHVNVQVSALDPKPRQMNVLQLYKMTLQQRLMADAEARKALRDSLQVTEVPEEATYGDTAGNVIDPVIGENANG